MAEVVLDSNVIVAILYAADSQHGRASELVDRLESQGHALVLLDFIVFEALSVLCRRAAERKTSPPDLEGAVAVMRGWFRAGEVRFYGGEVERLATNVLDVVASSGGALNSNDALLVVPEREGVVDTLATFDARFDRIEGFRRTS
jgi:predicted nucleic acid-binding protein